MLEDIVDSFNGKFRDESLNEYSFSKLAEARAIVTAWRGPPAKTIFGPTREA